MAATAPSPRGLPVSRRIRDGRTFQRAKIEGQRVVQGSLILNWMAQPGLTHSRLGVITSRKVGEAVMRSRSRRLLREAFRLHQHELAQPVNIILIARQSIRGKRFCEVERDYLAALHRSGLRRLPEPSS